VIRLAWAAVALLALHGCAAPPRVPEGGVAPDPAALRQWVASGRMAVAAGTDGGNGSFDWAQDGDVSRLDLRGPLGAGALQVIVAPGVLSMAGPGGRALDAEAAEADLRARLGADLPWNQLRFWMLGLPDPGQAAAVEDHGAAPWRTIEQGGWWLAYDSFAVVEGWKLPRRFALERDGVRVRVVVDQWSAVATGRRPAVGTP
jgi:outer membrane lipoprotein LolB